MTYPCPKCGGSDSVRFVGFTIPPTKKVEWNLNNVNGERWECNDCKNVFSIKYKKTKKIK